MTDTWLTVIAAGVWVLVCLAAVPTIFWAHDLFRFNPMGKLAPFGVRCVRFVEAIITYRGRLRDFAIKIGLMIMAFIRRNKS